MAKEASATGSRGGDATRDAFLGATAQLLRRQGYAASGLNEIVTASGAPKGSLYFHFPGGKEQLATEALTRAGAGLARAIESILASHEDLGEGLAALADALAAGLRSSGYNDGCPVATVALETASTSDPLRSAAAEAFESWLTPLRSRLEVAGIQPADAARRSVLILSAIEGALILARARHSTAPLLAVRDELGTLASVWTTPKRPRVSAPVVAAARSEKPAPRRSRAASTDAAPRRDRRAR